MKTVNLKTVKQSLCDWQVTKDGKAAAWISKGKDGIFTVTWRNDPIPFLATSFKEAKDMAYRISAN